MTYTGDNGAHPSDFSLTTRPTRQVLRWRKRLDFRKNEEVRMRFVQTAQVHDQPRRAIQSALGLAGPGAGHLHRYPGTFSTFCSFTVRVFAILSSVQFCNKLLEVNTNHQGYPISNKNEHLND